MKKKERLKTPHTKEKQDENKGIGSLYPKDPIT